MKTFKQIAIILKKQKQKIFNNDNTCAICLGDLHKIPYICYKNNDLHLSLCKHSLKKRQYKTDCGHVISYMLYIVIFMFYYICF